MSETATPQHTGNEPAAQAGPAAVTVTGNGVVFDFTYNGNSYQLSVGTPDKSGQYGFTLTETLTTGTVNTLASLIYAPATATTAEGWAIQAGIPKITVDGNLVVNSITINIAKGETAPLQLQ